MKKRKTEDNRIVLVGTYKGDQLTKWRGWYNNPVSEADQIAEADAAFRSLAEPSGDMTDGME